MKNKKLYEYVVNIQLDYQFIKHISINEQTKTVWFELVVLHNGNEYVLISSKREITFKQINKQIKDFLLATIGVEIFRENIYNKTIEELENGFKVNGKEFLLEDNKYAELREKVLNEVKNGLH